MSLLAETARCNDLSDTLSFLSFDTLTSADPRQCGGAKGVTRGKIDLAANKGFKYVAFDKVKTYRTALGPETPPQCSLVIPTGVSVVSRARPVINLFTGNSPAASTGEKHPDIICVNPLCHPDEKGKKCIP